LNRIVFGVDGEKNK